MSRATTFLAICFFEAGSHAEARPYFKARFHAKALRRKAFGVWGSESGGVRPATEPPPQLPTQFLCAFAPPRDTPPPLRASASLRRCQHKLFTRTDVGHALGARFAFDGE